jgi:hypothetical protein
MIKSSKLFDIGKGDLKLQRSGIFVVSLAPNDPQAP